MRDGDGLNGIGGTRDGRAITGRTGGEVGTARMDARGWRLLGVGRQVGLGELCQGKVG